MPGAGRPVFEELPEELWTVLAVLLASTADGESGEGCPFYAEYEPHWISRPEERIGVLVDLNGRTYITGCFRCFAVMGSYDLTSYLTPGWAGRFRTIKDMLDAFSSAQRTNLRDPVTRSYWFQWQARRATRDPQHALDQALGLDRFYDNLRK